MKNLRFLTGLIFGIIIGFSCFLFIKCKTDESNQEKLPDSFSTINELSKGAGGNVYKLTIDNIQYVVVETNAGVGIVRHR